MQNESKVEVQPRENRAVVGLVAIVFTIIAVVLIGLTMKPSKAEPAPQTPVEKQKQINDDVFREYAEIEVQAQTQQAELDATNRKLTELGTFKEAGIEQLKKIINGETEDTLDPREVQSSAEEQTPADTSTSQAIEEAAPVAASLPVDPNHISNFPAEVESLALCDQNENCRAEYAAWEARYDGQTAVRMALIMRNESGWRYTVDNVNTNGSTDSGFYQINSVHCGKVGDNCVERLKDPETARETAFAIYDAQGFSPWVAHIAKANGQVLYYRDRITIDS